jgi:hypothetical protein
MLTTLATVKEELPQIVAGDTSKDAYLTRLISQASAAIGNYCNRNFIRARATDTVAVPLNMATAQRLLLPRLPIITVYSVTMEASGSLVAEAGCILQALDDHVASRCLWPHHVQRHDDPCLTDTNAPLAIEFISLSATV